MLSCFDDEIIDNLNDEEVREHFKNLVENQFSHYRNNFPFDRIGTSRGETIDEICNTPIIPKGAGSYSEGSKQFDFADKASRGVGFNFQEENELNQICSIGIVHLCYLLHTALYGPIEKLEIEKRCESCEYCRQNRDYKFNIKYVDSKIFKMFMTELPDMYQNLKREYVKRIKLEEMIQDD